MSKFVVWVRCIFFLLMFLETSGQSGGVAGHRFPPDLSVIVFLIISIVLLIFLFNKNKKLQRQLEKNREEVKILKNQIQIQETSLPVSSNQTPVKEIHSPPSKTGVLVVLNTPETLSRVEETLGDTYDLKHLNDGLAALDFLSLLHLSDEEEEQFDLQVILLEMDLPMMDGLEFLKVLKNRSYFRHIPVIILKESANSPTLPLMRIGVDEFVPKIFNKNELESAVEGLISRLNERKAWWQNLEEQADWSGDSDSQSFEELMINDEEAHWLIKLEKAALEKVGDFNFTIEDLADHFNMSRRQFHRKTKQLLGLTPHQYFKEVQLHKAKWLLESGKVNSVKEASYEIGLKQTKHFSRQFRERFRKLPSEYLKS